MSQVQRMVFVVSENRDYIESFMNAADVNTTVYVVNPQSSDWIVESAQCKVLKSRFRSTKNTLIAIQMTKICEACIFTDGTCEGLKFIIAAEGPDYLAKLIPSLLPIEEQYGVEPRLVYNVENFLKYY